MVLIAVKYTEPKVTIADVSDLSVLGLERGGIILFSGTVISRNSSAPRTIIGGFHLRDGDQKIYFRHPSNVKITHASINSLRSLCCFVIQTESNNFDVYLAEIGLSKSGRLFSLGFSRANQIRAYLAPHDSILLLHNNVPTIFRVPNTGNSADKAINIDRDAQLNECLYYQWDTLEQILHVIQKRSTPSVKTATSAGFETLVYTAYTINARGQFNSTIKADFDFKIPTSSSDYSIFEILSNDTSLFICWQCIATERDPTIEYAVVSLGHGRSVYISKKLNQTNRDMFSRRRIHFGLLKGDYVFAALRGDFVHLISFNIPLNFVNHLFFPDTLMNLPFDTKYVTQRGLDINASTLLYDRGNLLTYTIEINLVEVLGTLSSSNMQSIIAYELVALKDYTTFGEILKQILFRNYVDLETKSHLKEILTGLIFNRVSKKSHHTKYAYVFPATTLDNNHVNNTEVSFRPYAHHREHIPQYVGVTNIDKDYYDKLRSSFEHSRKYRRKVSYNHPAMQNIDETPIKTNSPTNSLPRRSPTSTTPPSYSFFTFQRKHSKDSSSLSINDRLSDSQKSFLMEETKRTHLLENVSHEIQQLHPNWDPARIRDLAFEYVQATQTQCDQLIDMFSSLANYDRTRGLMDDENDQAPIKYKSLLVIMEKLYIAVEELDLSPTEALQRILLDLSFRVMPFDRFVAAIDQNILILTEEFVTRVINELGDDPKSYAIKEQLIFMLPNINSDLHARLFSLIQNDRAKRMTAQLLIARGFSTDLRRGSTTSHASATSREIDEMMDSNSNQNDSSSHSRLVEQAAVTFLRDCNQRGLLDDEQLSQVKVGLLSLASSVP